MELSLGLAFIAGVISFVSPCVLALVPVYLAYMGETAASTESTEPRGGGVAAAFSQPVVGQVALFALAFGSIFVLLGISVGLLGVSLFRLIPFAREATGLIVIAVGLLMTGFFGPVLERVGWRPSLAALPASRSMRSLSLGALFALGWSPCIGPVLGAILTLGASSQDVGAAALLLAFYSLGLAIPFLAAGAALPRLRPLLAALRRWHRAVEIVAGLFIVLMGALIYLDAFTRMASLFTWAL